MQFRIYAIRDNKAEAFLQPFFCPTLGVALRAFQEVANDKKTNIGKYVSDHSLYEIGLFDDQMGKIQSYDVPDLKGHAIDFIDTPAVSPSYNPERN